MASCAPFWRGCSWRSTEGEPTWPVTAGARGPSRGPGANEIAGPHPASYIEGSDTYDNGVIPMVRKFGLLLCCAVLLGSESVYFARLTAAKYTLSDPRRTAQHSRRPNLRTIGITPLS